ncbi:MAG: zinc transport system substrate-binding protein [Chloroflexi bacterium]|jgi:zinc transport system substrate-binding protein|nr:MAG: zinc transport system substrate-binding protein [Chloroflexota bacterium]
MLYISKKIYVPLLLLIGCFSLSCSSNIVNTSPNDKISVATSIFPIYSIANQIATDKIIVNLLIQPGDSPHTFTPTISAKQITERVDRVYIIDDNFDYAILNIIDDKSKKLALNNNIKLRKYDDAEHKDDDAEHKDDDAEHKDDDAEHKDDDAEHKDDDGHAHGEYDPHYWLSPNNAIQIARNITDDLKEIDPGNASAYEKNYDTFEKSVSNLFVQLKEDVSEITDRPFIVMHEGWDYFIDAFELNLVGAFETVGAESPTPKYLAGLQETINEKNVVAIFSEPQLSVSSIQQFIKDNDLLTAVLDPIGGIDGRMTYQELIKYNVSTLVKTLR